MTTAKRISVIVFKPADRPYFVAQWADPTTGRKKTRSLGTNIRRDAEREAAALAKELNDGTYHSPRHVEWSTFRERYEDDVVPGLAPKTAKKVRATFNAVEEHIKPSRLAAVTAEQLGTLSKRLRLKGRSENTVKSHLSHLRAAMRWAKRVGMLVEVPQFEMPKRLKTARHRACTLEEFERMLGKVLDVVKDAAAVPSWRFLLRGLWASGLRLGESLNLTWDDDRKLKLQLAGRFPMLWIPAELQKNHRNGLIPLSPEFVELLRTVPESERTGHVFNPARLDGHHCGRIGPHRVGVTIAAIGKRAKVAVNVDPTTGTVEYASAHDLRRSFGFRWSQKVMPAVLKEMMRHSSINTTMQFYALGTAEATAATLWEVHKAARIANGFANSDNFERSEPAQEKAASAIH
jgi:integrase